MTICDTTSKHQTKTLHSLSLLHSPSYSLPPPIQFDPIHLTHSDSYVLNPTQQPINFVVRLYFRLCLTGPRFQRLLQLRPCLPNASKGEPSGLLKHDISQAGCPVNSQPKHKKGKAKRAYLSRWKQLDVDEVTSKLLAIKSFH